jgi:hypothetical protein
MHEWFVLPRSLVTFGSGNDRVLLIVEAGFHSF